MNKTLRKFDDRIAACEDKIDDLCGQYPNVQRGHPAMRIITMEQIKIENLQAKRDKFEREELAF